MSAPPRFLAPQVDGSIHTWRFGQVSFQVDAAQGARVVDFSLGGRNILSGSDINALNFGSTFWTSPQADWGWPPVVEIDSRPYHVDGAGADLRFQSASAGGSGIAVGKRFRVDTVRELVTIVYTVENQSAEPRSLAPWEISRVATEGLTFFPIGAGVQPRSTLAVSQSGGVVWFRYDAAAITDHQKVFAHGSEGWLAHVDVPGRLLLIKSFPQIAPGEQAPGEAHVELYADPEHTYVEIEQQGAYRELVAGARITWSVSWRLRRLPLNIDATTGSRDLLALVRGLVVSDPPAG